jgi:hypothetical protein
MNSRTLLSPAVNEGLCDPDEHSDNPKEADPRSAATFGRWVVIDWRAATPPAATMLKRLLDGEKAGDVVH